VRNDRFNWRLTKDPYSENLQAMAKYYPSDYRMRLYFDVDPSSSTRRRLCQLKCGTELGRSRLFLCDVKKNPKYGDAGILYPLIWRFLPVMDPQVELLLSRDLDSVISSRETSAFAEFMAENASFHVMRDHPNHGIHILGESKSS